MLVVVVVVIVVPVVVVIVAVVVIAVGVAVVEVTAISASENIFISRISSASLKGRKEMFYLTTHSTHFIYGYMPN